MNNQRILLIALITTTVITQLSSLKSVSASAQISNQAIAKPILTARGGGGPVGTGVGLAIDGAKLGLQINDLVVASKNREGFVKGLMEQATFAANNKYNVMVLNMSLSFDRHINGEKFFKQVNYQGIPYGIWIFRDGDFTNKGDGGFINWAFSGNFKRSGDQGKFVKFSKI